MAITFKRGFRLRFGKPQRPEYTKFPPPVQEIFDQRETINESAVPHHGPDIAMIILFRIYVALVSGEDLWMRTEVERFWNHHEWRVSELQDPRDADPVRYAVLATIPYLLVRAFNANIELGLPRNAPPFWTYEQEMEFTSRPKQFESVPEWAINVPALDTQLLIPDFQGNLPSGESDRTTDPDMLRKNILTTMQPVLFI